MINVAMPDGSIRQFGSVSMQFNYAIANGGVPIRNDGTPYQVRQFLPNVGEVPEGTPGAGYLLDDCPMNIVLGQGWVPGQSPALEEQGIHCQAKGSQCGCCPGGPSTGMPNNPSDAMETGGSIQADPYPFVTTPMDNAARIIEFTRRFPLNTIIY